MEVRKKNKLEMKILKEGKHTFQTSFKTWGWDIIPSSLIVNGIMLVVEWFKYVLKAMKHVKVFEILKADYEAVQYTIGVKDEQSELAT